MKTPFFFLQQRKPPSRVLRVRVIGNVVARNLAGEVVTLAPDQEIDLPEAVAQELVRSSKGEILGRVKDGKFSTPAQLAAPATQFVPPPEPEGLADLPQVFRDTYALEIAREKLRFEARQAYRARVDFRATGRDVDEAAAELRRLEAREENANALAKGFDTEKLERGLHAAGQIVIAEAGGLNEAISELHRVAFEAFSVRIAALELSEAKAKNLFAGSALYVRYVHPAQPYVLGNIRRAGGPVRGGFFLDMDINQMVGTLAHIRRERTRIDGLLESARAEFERTKKAVKRAA